jgi:hypothetical protein
MQVMLSPDKSWLFHISMAAKKANLSNQQKVPKTGAKATQMPKDPKRIYTKSYGCVYGAYKFS